jgi:hypothetical protein
MPSYEDAIQDPDIVGLEEVSPHPNFLVFGGSGSGKTVLGGSDDRVLFISTEPEGCLSARRFGSSARQVIVRQYNDIERFYEKAYRWSKTSEGIPFTWFVFDSITKGQDLLMEHILSEANKIVEDWPEYRKNQKMLLRLVNKFNALPVNMLWLALDRKETDPDGEEFYCPEIHGKGYSIAMQVAAAMTSYGYLQVRSDKVPMVEGGKPVMNPKTGKQRITLETHRFIYWQDIQSLRGKDRTLALAPYTKDLTLKDIRERVEKAFAGVAIQETGEKEK